MAGRALLDIDAGEGGSGGGPIVGVAADAARLAGGTSNLRLQGIATSPASAEPEKDISSLT